jgi:HlyD family secretion protein
VSTTARGFGGAKLALKWSLMAAGIVCAGLVGASLLRSNNQKTASADSAPAKTAPAPAAGRAVRVETTKPTQSTAGQITNQIGKLYSFESAELFAKISGFLKAQNVDIGDHVKRGQVLVEIDAPELAIEVDEAMAALAQSKAEVDQMTSRVATAEADREAAVAVIAQSEAELKRATFEHSFREKQYRRTKDLFKLDSVDEELVDERQDQMEAAQAAEDAARATIVSSKAHVTAASAKIEQAKADVLNARAKVQVAEANVNRAKVFVEYTRIVSPFDGVVTKRSFDRGDFIRAAERGGEVPVLAVARTDLMRVVVQMPDQLVPLVDAGDKATIEIDALPGKSFSGKISRLANSEDAQSLTMRTEIDLPNTTGRLRQGMYASVTIEFQPQAAILAIPSACLVGQSKDGKGSVYVVRDNKVYLTPVEIAADSGLQVQIRRGLQAEDDVITRHNGPIQDGVVVEISKKKGP